MPTLLARLWRDDGGALISTEWLFVATILVLGSITGLVAMRQALLSTMTEMADTMLSVKPNEMQGSLPHSTPPATPDVQDDEFFEKTGSHLRGDSPVD